MMSDELIEIGTTGRPHGVQGELRFHLAWRYRDAIPGLDKVYLSRGEGAPREAVIETVRPHNDVYLVRLDVAPDRTAAESLRGVALFARAEDLEEAGCTGPFPEQMIGMEVLTEAGEPVGTLAGVDEYPAGDMFIVEMGEKEHLIPAVADIVRSVDFDSRKITVALPPGLLDLNP